MSETMEMNGTHDTEAVVLRDTAPELSPMEMEPSQFEEMISRHRQNYITLHKHLAEVFKPKEDYYEIRGNKSLAKGGGQKVIRFLGLYVNYRGIQELREAIRSGQEIEQWVFECDLVARDGSVVATGAGARSMSQDGGDLNKFIKMGKKSCMIDAALDAGGLSAIGYTQDIEDMDSAQMSAPPRPNMPTQKQMAEFESLMQWGVDTDQIKQSDFDLAMDWANKTTSDNIKNKIEQWQSRRIEYQQAIDETGETDTNPDLGQLDDLLEWAQHKGIVITEENIDRDNPSSVANAVEYFEARQEWDTKITDKQKEVTALADMGAIDDDKFMIVCDDLVALKKEPDTVTTSKIENTFMTICERLDEFVSEMPDGAEEGAQVEETALA